MSSSELMTLLTEARERLTTMEALVAKMSAKEAKKAAKKAAKDGSAAPSSPVAKPLPASPLPASPKAPDAPKKAPNTWILFTIRVNDLLKKNEVPLPGAEQKQFCGILKEHLMEELKKVKLMAEDYEKMSDEAILDARKVWIKPEASKQFLAGKNKKSDGSSSGSEKKRGRPKKVASVASDSELSASETSAAE